LRDYVSEVMRDGLLLWEECYRDVTLSVPVSEVVRVTKLKVVRVTKLKVVRVTKLKVVRVTKTKTVRVTHLTV